MQERNSQGRRRTIAVVGAGPAGLMAAIAAAEQGAAVTVFEALPRPGSRLLASGGGRCNLTNTLPRDHFMARFGRRGRFMWPALEAMDSEGLRDFLRVLGVETVCEGDGLVFPESSSAATVLSALLERCRQLGVAFRSSCRVTGLGVDHGALAGLQAGGEMVPVDAAVIAAGGCTYPKLGGSHAGYELARQAGHEIVDPAPALVPLVTRETWPARCAGVSLSQVRVWIDLPKQPRAGVTGELLLTHRGVSGPAVLNISGDVAGLLRTHPQVPLAIDLTAGVRLSGEAGPPSRRRWLAEFDAWRQGQGRRRIRRLLGEHLPLSLVGELCVLAGVAVTTIAAEISAEGREALAELLTQLPLTAVATEGLDRAMVTRGGVDLRQVDPQRLESRLVRGLFFAGEVLDLDGPCGGFNLQWAFSSGRLAGLSAAAT